MGEEASSLQSNSQWMETQDKGITTISTGGIESRLLLLLLPVARGFDDNKRTKRRLGDCKAAQEAILLLSLSLSLKIDDIFVELQVFTSRVKGLCVIGDIPDRNACCIASSPVLEGPLYCCPQTGPIILWRFSNKAPLQVRKPAHELNKDDVAKFKAAVQVMKDLDPKDPWLFSLLWEDQHISD
ncbi:hypothetical protein AAC387_Pa01g3525 [Persea americana]